MCPESAGLGIWRVERFREGGMVGNWEGGNVAKAVVAGWMCAWKFWVWGGAVFVSRPEIRKNALSFLRI